MVDNNTPKNQRWSTFCIFVLLLRWSTSYFLPYYIRKTTTHGYGRKSRERGEKGSQFWFFGYFAPWLEDTDEMRPLVDLCHVRLWLLVWSLKALNINIASHLVSYMVSRRRSNARNFSSFMAIASVPRDTHTECPWTLDTRVSIGTLAIAESIPYHVSCLMPLCGGNDTLVKLSIWEIDSHRAERSEAWVL
jgi:hypothetical protein